MRRMVGHDVAAAFRAELTVTHRRLHEMADKLRAFRDLDVAGLPQSEGVHRPCRPGTAGTAGTVTHRLGCARDFDLDGAAKARAGMFGCHVTSPCRRLPTDSLTRLNQS